MTGRSDGFAPAMEIGYRRAGWRSLPHKLQPFGYKSRSRAQQPGRMRRIGALMGYAESDSEASRRSGTG
jgi:hypothetical protein